MKVLFLTSWYPSPENQAFGIFVKEHAKAVHTIASAEIIVFAFLFVRSGDLFSMNKRDYVDENGIRTFEITIKSRFRDVFYHLMPFQKRMAYRYFKKNISPDFQPDIIHSNVVFPSGIIGDYIAKKIKKPHIITEHWSKIASVLQKPYLSTLARNSYKHAAFILPVSDFLKSRILQLIPGLSSEKLISIPNIIDGQTFKFDKKDISSSEIRFCAVATWATKRIPDKTPELFIEALNILAKKTEKSIHLTMIGGGDRISELKALADKQDYPIDFTGALSKPEIARILQKTNFLVHASTIETFGVVTAEALMTGTPVICSNVGALPELVNDTNGVLCENTVESWLNGVEKALATSFDNQKIAESVRNKFSYKSVGQKIEEVYKSIEI